VEFLFNHWEALAGIMALLGQAYMAVRAKQWDKLVQLAGQLAFEAAKLTGLDDPGKRELVEGQLYDKAGSIARLLFTREQFRLAVETGYKLIAKPKMAEEGMKP